MGSRETPEDFLVLQHHVGKVFCDLGWHGFSGLAPGPDQTYWGGAKQSHRYGEVGFTNIIPWNGFKGSATSLEQFWHDPAEGIYALNFLPHRKRAFYLGIGARGTGAGLGRGGFAMHTRNAMQILDLDLRTPCRLVHCYAKPVGISGHVKGGTATAVALAIHFGIPVINLATKEGLARTLTLLKNNNVEIDYEYYESLGAQMKL